MKVIKKIQHWLWMKQFRVKMRSRIALELHTTPHTQLKVLKQLDCMLYGHEWATEPQDELNKPIKQRTYCKRCGKYYSEEAYKEL